MTTIYRPINRAMCMCLQIGLITFAGLRHAGCPIGISIGGFFIFGGTLTVMCGLEALETVHLLNRNKGFVLVHPARFQNEAQSQYFFSLRAVYIQQTTLNSHYG